GADLRGGVDRPAEVPLKETAEPVGVLHEDRPVVAELRRHGGHRLLVGRLAEDRPDDVFEGQAQQQEGDERDQQREDESGQETPQDVESHRVFPIRAVRRRKATASRQDHSVTSKRRTDWIALEPSSTISTPSREAQVEPMKAIGTVRACSTAYSLSSR